MIEQMKGSPKELIERDAAKVVEMVQSQTGRDPGLKRIGSALRTTSDILYGQPSLLESYTLAYENLGVSLLNKPAGILDIAFELIAPTLIGELGECLPDGHRSVQFCRQVGAMRHPANGVADFSSRFTMAKSKIHQVGSLARLVPDDPHTPRRVYEDIRSQFLAS